MSKNTRIRIFFCLFAAIAVFSYVVGYQLTNPTRQNNKQEAEAVEESASENETFETLLQEQHVLFRIRELDGYLAVYLADGVTLYMNTDIRPEDIEEELREELRDGIPFYTMDSLYEFLESYSS
jgi:hypothetical protein